MTELEHDRAGGVTDPFWPQELVALPLAAMPAVIPPMNSTKSREVIWGGRIRAAKMNAESARQRAIEAAREADRAEAHAWSLLRMEGYGGPAQPSPSIRQCPNGGYGWLEVRCHRCETEVSIPRARRLGTRDVAEQSRRRFVT